MTSGGAIQKNLSQKAKVGCLFAVVVEVERRVVEEEGDVGIAEVVELASVLFGGTACASGAVDEAADAVHLEDVVLLAGREVLEHLGHELGADTVLDGLKHAEGVGDGGLADGDGVAFVDGLRGFGGGAVNGDSPVLAGVGGQRAGLIEPHSPEPFVNPCFHRLLV